MNLGIAIFDIDRKTILKLMSKYNLPQYSIYLWSLLLVTSLSISGQVFPKSNTGAFDCFAF